MGDGILVHYCWSRALPVFVARDNARHPPNDAVCEVVSTYPGDPRGSAPRVATESSGGLESEKGFLQRYQPFWLPSDR